LCKRIGEALNIANRGDARVKAAFNKKTPGEQRDYMRNQKRKREQADKNARYNFEDLTVEEESFYSAGAEGRVRFEWEPYGEFEDRMLMTRRFENVEESRTEWHRLLTDDPSIVKKQVCGEWCIRRFKGAIDDNVESRGVRTAAKRRKKVDDQATLEEMMKAASERIAAHQATGTPVTTVGCAGHVVHAQVAYKFSKGVLLGGAWRDRNLTSC
jgi:hypothetical protein